MKLNLKAARLQANLSVEEVAKALEVSDDTIYNYEKYLRTMKVDVALKMAELYGLTMDQIDFLPPCSTKSKKGV